MANEKRLIDANVLLEEQRIMYHYSHLENAPTVDAVEVVRCKDCKYAKPYERVDGSTGYYCQHPKSTFMYGTNWERLFEPVREADDFCSYGERKDDG